MLSLCAFLLHHLSLFSSGGQTILMQVLYLLVFLLCCEMHLGTQSCLCRLALTSMAEVLRTRPPCGQRQPRRGKRRGWRGIITYHTFIQLFHNTWRQQIRSLGVIAVETREKLLMSSCSDEMKLLLRLGQPSQSDLCRYIIALERS